MCYEPETVPGESLPVDDLESRLSPIGYEPETVDGAPPPTECTAANLDMARQAFESEMCNAFSSIPRASHVLLCELCCSPTSVLSATCHQMLGQQSAVRMSDWNGYDMGTEDGVKLACKALKRFQPRVLWISSECGPYSPLQNINTRTTQQIENLRRKRETAMVMHKHCMRVAREAKRLSIHVVWEWSQRSHAWNLPEYLAFSDEMRMYTGVCNGCQVNLRNKENQLLCKAWRLDSTWPELSKHMNLRCGGQHSKGVCEGGVYFTAYYTPEFAKRLVKFLQRDREQSSHVALLQWSHVSDVEGEREVREGSAEEEEEREEEESPENHVMSQEERTRVLGLLKKIHSSTGHCSNQMLVQNLKRRGASEAVLKLARDFKCDVCREWSRPSPRPPSSLRQIARKWESCIMDCGYWRHPNSGENWLFVLCIDEGSRVRVGRLVREGAHVKINADDVKKCLSEQWFSVFGNPAVIRTDAESPLRGLQLDGWLQEKGILLDHAPPEAHWQISPVERAIQSTKDIMWKLSGEFPEMPVLELFARALWAQNHRDQYLGYSPLQHAFGRNPQDDRSIADNKLLDIPILIEAGVSAQYGHDVEAMKVAETAFLDSQAKERLKRASQSGHRMMKHFCPGDLVYAWRKAVSRSDGGRNFVAGRFVGPFRVLATETRTSEGNLQPGQCVWLYRGNRLTRAAPQQLRPATAREEAWSELVDARKDVPWTIHEILAKSERKAYEDIRDEALEMPDLVDPEEDRQEREVPRYRVRHKGPPGLGSAEASSASRPPQARPRSRSPVPGREVDEAPPEPRAKQARPDYVHQALLANELSMSPCEYWKDENAMVEVAIDLPQWSSPQRKEMMRDFSAFIVRQLKRQNTEVSERRMSEDEKMEFRAAKQKEVNNYVASKVLSALPTHLKPDLSQAMHALGSDLESIRIRREKGQGSVCDLGIPRPSI